MERRAGYAIRGEQEGAPALLGLQAGTVCPACGKLVKVGAKFCMNCGTPIPAAPVVEPPKGSSCKNCGAPVKPGAKFCMKCGAPL